MTFAEYLEGLKQKNKGIDFDPIFSEKFKEIDGCLYSHKDLILKEMATAYEGSPTVREMFEIWFKNNKKIEFKYQENISDAHAGFGIVNFDLDYATSILYIDDYGKTVEYELLAVLVHELSHALKGTRDYVNNLLMHKDKIEVIPGLIWHEHPSTVYKSENLVYTEKIWRELLENKGIEITAQNSYLGSDGRLGAGGKVLTPGYSYTGGQKIERSVVLAFKAGVESRDGIDNWDSSDTGYSRDLLIGNANNNTLISGGGDDFLYGLGGNDRLFGGDGIDYLYGDDKEGQTTGDDVLYGGGGGDWLYGGGGKDQLYGDKDVIFDDPKKALNQRVETIIDSDDPGDDHLFGGAGDDELWGGGGNDYLYGDDQAGAMEIKKDGQGNNIGAGDDHLHGGSGLNFLYGGKGEDTYYIGAPDEGGKRTFDFIKDSDGNGKIVLETNQDIQLTGGRLVGKNGFTWSKYIDL